MKLQLKNYDIRELDLNESKNIDGGIILHPVKSMVEFGILVVGASYAAGYALGEFAYNITH